MERLTRKARWSKLNSAQNAKEMNAVTLMQEAHTLLNTIPDEESVRYVIRVIKTLQNLPESEKVPAKPGWKQQRQNM